MRIQVVSKLTPFRIDMELDRFQPGCQYEVDSAIGYLFIAEGWAVEIADAGTDAHSRSQDPREKTLLSVKDAIAADAALDDAIAAAIERQAR